MAAYKGQRYWSLKRECLKKGELFTDPEFPPNAKSLFFSKIDNDIEWKRPKELCKVPRLVVEGVTCDDLCEGELGNSWFVSACSALAKEPKLWHKVIVDVKEQEWGGPDVDYAGIFHFMFWRYGSWIDVVIDDQLPTKDGKLIFCHSSARNEFWSALLEKAYAKLYGDYETLVNGYAADALVDFTGGVPESLDLTKMELSSVEVRDNLFCDMLDASDNRSLILCNIHVSDREKGEVMDNGLVKGHGYGVTDVRSVKVAKQLQKQLGGATLQLVRIRNPWGTKEWNGAWSDDSEEWKILSGKDRDKMGITFEQEGEFWMCFDDFVDNFTNVDICHFVNTSFFSLKKTWTEGLTNGAWTHGARGTTQDRCGGDVNNRTFLQNPQYSFDITALTDTVLVCLDQEDVSAGKQTGAKHLEIGFSIWQVEDNRIFRIHDRNFHECVAVSPYVAKRNIFARIFMKRGRYVILPTTTRPNQTGGFLLRMYMSSTGNVRPLDKECPKTSGFCVKPPSIVTRIKVIRAEGLVRQKETQSLDAQAVVKCEGETVKSAWVKNNLNPEWNMQCIFYRKKPSVPITVEIWNHNQLIDDFLGLGEVTEVGTEDPSQHELQFMGKGKKGKDIIMPGKVVVEITTSHDLMDL